MAATLNGTSSAGDASQATSLIIAADVANLDGDAMRGTNLAALASVLGALTDAGSLALDTATVVALAREAAKESWEIERHFHAGDFGFGAAAVPAGETHIADRVGSGAAGAEIAPFVLDAGNDDWGTWTQVLGSSDTPTAVVASATHFDFNEMTIVATEDDEQRYMWELVVQEDAPADDPQNGDYATSGEFYIQAAAVQGSPVLPTRIFRCYRRPVATKIWMRLRAPNLNTSTASFYLYGHFYIDPDT